MNSRERILNRADLVSSVVLIDNDFVTNIPRGCNKPLAGEPIIYYMFATLVSRHRTKSGKIKEIRTKYIHELISPTQAGIDEALLELATRPGFVVQDLVAQ